MKKFFLLAVLVSAPVVAADIGKYDTEKYTITITDQPCTNKTVLEMTLPNFRDKVKAGRGEFKTAEFIKMAGKDKVELCYIEAEGGVHWMDELGQSASRPRSQFK